MRFSSPDGDSGNRFYVLLGPDYTGKSVFLDKIKGYPEWQPISYDDGILDPRYEILATLKRDFFRSLAKGCHFSTDFLLAGFQMPVMYLRDQVLENLQRSNVIVDSYYYKILAKCVLKGIINPAIFDLWRASPQPDRVILLETDRESQWQRARRSGRLNPFEYYGNRPTRSGFFAFQSDLSQQLIEETQGLPVDVIRLEGSLDDLQSRVLQRLSRPLPDASRDLTAHRPSHQPVLISSAS